MPGENDAAAKQDLELGTEAIDCRRRPMPAGSRALLMPVVRGGGLRIRCQD